MNRSAIVTIMLVLQVSWTVAQQPDYGKIGTITAGINKGDTQAMLEAGKSESSIYIDPLRKFLEKAEYAELALAKLGDKKAFNKIVAEIESEDPQIARRSVEFKLPYIGGAESIRVLAQIIMNPKFDVAPLGRGGVAFLPLKDYAIKAFVQLVPEVPVNHAFVDAGPVFIETQRVEIREKILGWIREHPRYLE